MNPSEPASRFPRILAAVVRGLPTLVVLGLAAGVGWWGHHTGWKFPKLAALRGWADAPKDWCDEHSVPESICVECNAALLPRPKAFGWCRDHGVHECPLCHPELAQTRSPAEVTAEDRERAARSLAFAPRPENNPLCKLYLRRVQFASADAAAKAGVEVESVGLGPVVEFVAAAGEITYDQSRVAHLSVRSPGSVWRVFKRLGDAVKPGDLLALVDAAEVGKAKAELLQAVALARLKADTLATLNTTPSVPPRSVREAEFALREAKVRRDAARQALVNLGLPIPADDIEKLSETELDRRLHFLGLPADIVRGLDPATTTANLLPLVAPLAGVVVSRDIVAGEVVSPTTMVFEVVDTAHLWLTLDLKAEDARRVRAGLPVRFRPDADPRELVGTLSWVSTQADPRTRTVKARAEIADPDGKLRANTFGAGRVILRDEPKVVRIPTSAIHWEGDCHVVFVRDRDYLRDDGLKVFHTRTVRPGAKTDTHTEIVAGVLPGEVVATTNSGVLRAELLRGSLGEG